MNAAFSVSSLQKSASLICDALKKYDVVDVFDCETMLGYTVRLKLANKPIAELTEIELRRELRKIRNPQPHDVSMTPWRATEYVGLDMGLKSSSFGKAAA